MKVIRKTNDVPMRPFENVDVSKKQLRQSPSIGLIKLLPRQRRRPRHRENPNGDLLADREVHLEVHLEAVVEAPEKKVDIEEDPDPVGIRLVLLRTQIGSDDHGFEFIFLQVDCCLRVMNPSTLMNDKLMMN